MVPTDTLLCHIVKPVTWVAITHWYCDYTGLSLERRREEGEDKEGGVRREEGGEKEGGKRKGGKLGEKEKRREERMQREGGKDGRREERGESH